MEEKRTIYSMSVETKLLLEYMRRTIAADAFWSYADLDKAAGCDVRKNGYIQTARRNLEREGWVTGPVPGVGVRVLTPEEAVRSASRDITHIRRTAMRAVNRITTPDPEKLDAPSRIQLEKNITVLQVVRQFSKPKTVRLIEERIESGEPKRLPIAETLEMFK